MKITISQYAGFCFGAKEAYETTIKIAQENNKDLYILGDLLHNKDVIEKIKNLGVKKISNINEMKKGRLIITAHGDGENIFKIAQKKNIEIINTTCPKVIKIQQLAKLFSQKKYTIIIFGNKNHKEVKGINGWCKNKAIIIESLNEAEKINFQKIDKAIIVAQTTQKTKKYQKIVNFLKEKIKNLEIFDTICDATKNRQKECEIIAQNNEAMIVIGGKHSSNSKKLAEISRKNNLNTFFVQNIKELPLDKIKKYKTIGITAGASTPKKIIKEIYNTLKNL